jgi:hypothetical protein
MPAARAVSFCSVSPGGDPSIAVTRAATSVWGSGPSLTIAPPWRFTLNPHHRALTASENLGASTEDRELLLAAHPLGRPVNGPHVSNVRPPVTTAAITTIR